jgi:flavin-dependent thymidylate synthase
MDHESLRLISSYLTNSDKNVFCTRNLPEEVVAKLFAVYSRSPKSLRENLYDMLGPALKSRAAKLVHLQSILSNQEPGNERLLSAVLDLDVFEEAQKNAGQFHDRWVLNYGHASVAEHAVVHIGVERCSIKAAKALEDPRLAAYTEKSTRYVDFRDVPLPEPSSLGVPPEYAEQFSKAMAHLVRNYAAMVDLTIRHLKNTSEQPEGTTEKAFDTQLRTKAYDLCRGLLPIGMPTSLGMTFNARELAHSLKKWSASKYHEERELAATIREETLKVCPTLLKYSEDDGARTETDFTTTQLLRSCAARIPLKRTASQVFVESLSPNSELSLLCGAINRELAGDSTPGYINPEQMNAILRAYLSRPSSNPAKRMFQQPGRALEAINFLSMVVVDYGAWRDLQRHRLLTHLDSPNFWTDLGYCTPDEIAAAPELAVQYSEAIDEASYIWGLYGLTLPSNSRYEWTEYLHIMAKNIRWTAIGNLREWFYFAERRSHKQGHISYRRVAQEIARQIQEYLPVLKEPGIWDVDWTDTYKFARSGT